MPDPTVLLRQLLLVERDVFDHRAVGPMLGNKIMCEPYVSGHEAVESFPNTSPEGVIAEGHGAVRPYADLTQETLYVVIVADRFSISAEDGALPISVMFDQGRVGNAIREGATYAIIGREREKVRGHPCS